MYYIYEIPGVKVGCTQDMERRQKQQRDKGKMVLLESYTCIEDATRRERELQLEKGYGIDGNSYSKQLILVEMTKDPRVIKKRVANIDYKEVHAKGAPKRKTYYKAFREFNESKMKKVLRYTLNGKFVDSFNSLADAGKHTDVYKGNIGACCRKEQKTAGGYIWKYAQ